MSKSETKEKPTSIQPYMYAVLAPSKPFSSKLVIDAVSPLRSFEMGGGKARIMQRGHHPRRHRQSHVQIDNLLQSPRFYRMRYMLESPYVEETPTLPTTHTHISTTQISCWGGGCGGYSSNRLSFFRSNLDCTRR